MKFKFYFSVLSMLTILGFSIKSKAQLSASDSAYFQNIFTNPIYVDTVLNPGNWYQYEPITSMYNHYLILDTNFKFKTADLDSIDYLTIDDSMHYETVINNSFNQSPWLLNQLDPIVNVPYTFLNKHSKTYSFLYPDTNANSTCRTAFLIVPGTGINASCDIVRGVGYHNLLCQMVSNCRTFGDVYTFIKPNEEHRAVYWNNLKLNEYIVNYLITQNTHYGINYVIEMIAMIKYLKSNYDKVFLFGLSEGGYSSLLATMYIQPDAAMISGGYSMNFDTCWVEKNILKTRFDYLLDTFDQVKVKDKISQSKTQYLFTWGENDPVLTMDPEHDFHYTQNYYNGLTNCSYFYDFYDHTFPPCTNIDTFINRILSIPEAHFFVTDSSLTDTLLTRVRFCKSSQYQFDLYKDNIFLQTYTMISDSIDLPLTDSGTYYIVNVLDSSMISGRCRDTITSQKQGFPVGINSIQKSEVQFEVNNPFQEQLNIKLITNEKVDDINLTIHDMFGRIIFQSRIIGNEMKIPTSNWSSGWYLLSLNQQGKVINKKLLKSR